MRHAFATMVALAAFFGSSVPSEAQPGKKTEDTKKTGELVGGKTLDQWIEELKSKDPYKVERAVAMLKLYGIAARPAIPAIIKTMAHQDVALRVNAIIALGMIGMNPEHVTMGVAALTRALNDTQGIVRYQSAMALGRLGVEARSSVTALINLIRDQQSWEIRHAAAFALGSVAGSTDIKKPLPPDTRVIKALLGALSDVSSQVRLEAVLSLITLGPPDSLADKKYTLDILHQLLANDRDLIVKIWARMGLMRMDKVVDTHVKEIGKFLRNSDVEVSIHAARALATIGPDAKSQVPYLMQELSHKDLTMVYWVIVALAQMGDAAHPALPTLAELANHKDEAVKGAAKEAIEKIKAKKK